MKNTITSLAIRFVLGSKYIVSSSIIGVMVSISLIITMVVFSVNAQQSIRTEVQKMFGNMDLSVGYSAEQTKYIDDNLKDLIVSNDQIIQYSSVLLTRLKIKELNNGELYSIGVENDSMAKSRYHFKKDLLYNEVIINKGLAEALRVKEMDKITINDKKFMVKEIIDDLTASGASANIVILSKSKVDQFMFEQSGLRTEATYILIKAAEGADIVALANRIRQLDIDLRIDIAQEEQYLKNNLATLNHFIVILSVLVLITTSLLIISNFEVLLYKNRNQFAIMRSIGATTNQMFRLVWIQSSFINIIGSVSGFIFALLSHQYLQRWFQLMFSFEVNSTVFNYKISIFVTLICMLFIGMFMFYPSYRCSKVLPTKLMRENEKIDFSHKKIRKKLGRILLIVSACLIVFSIMSHYLEGQAQPLLLLFSVLFLLNGIYLLVPLYLPILLNQFLPVTKRIFGKVTLVAVKNIIPQVRNNTFVLLSVSMIMMISVFGSTALHTISKNEENHLKKQYATDILVTGGLISTSSVRPDELRKAVDGVKSVENVSVISTPFEASIKKGKKNISFTYTLVDLSRLAEQRLIPQINGDTQNIIVITENFAVKNNIMIGDILQIEQYSEKAQQMVSTGTLLVENIVPNLPGTYIPAYLDWENTKYLNQFTRFDRAFVSTKDAKTTMNDLLFLKSQFPGVQLNSFEQSLQQSKHMFYQRWSIFIVVLVIMLISVLIGVINTLISNINFKRKEFAILRTLSVGESGILKVILTQVIIYILLGSILGVIIGLIIAFILNLIDKAFGIPHYNFVPLIGTFLILFISINAVFIPFAYRIGKKKIIFELTNDNK